MGETRNIQTFDLSGAQGISIGNVTNVGTPRQEPVAEQTEPACRILLLGANPAGTSRLRLDREARAIEDALRGAPGDRRFELIQGWASSSLDLQQDLFGHRPEVVHFAGHGGAAGELALEAQRFRDLVRTGEGGPSAPGRGGMMASISALVRLIAHAPGRIRCVVLNACHSAALAAAVAEHVDCAVGMTTAVPDDGAVGFAWGFYHALGQGESVAAAFGLASAQLEAHLASQPSCARLFATRCDPAGIRWGDGAAHPKR
jgi:hypothetical protein